MKTINKQKNKCRHFTDLRKKLISLFVLMVLVSCTAYAQMNWNYACVFPGAGYIAVPNTNPINPVFTFNLDIFTLECWVCPFNALIPQKQIIMQKVQGTDNKGYCMYLDSGRLAVKTNNITRVISNVVIPSQKWTHVAVSFYNERIFSLYINGILDVRDTINYAFPVSNPDSLYIGTGSEANFHGIMDEIRIWHRALPDSEVYRNMRTTLGTQAGYVYNGYYSLLVLSLTFQTSNGCGNIINPPIMYDWSGCGNVGLPRNVYLTDQSNRPYNTIDNNEALDNTQGGYVASPHDPLNSPSNAITIEFWVYCDHGNSYKIFVEKSHSGFTAYRIQAGPPTSIINAIINNVGIPLAPFGLDYFTWNHVAFTYDGTTGQYCYYLNGQLELTGTDNVGPIVNSSTDSLYIGAGAYGNEHLGGFMDEVRISNYIKTQQEIQQDMFRSINCMNVPHPQNNNLCYAFDGYAIDNINFTSLPCYFRGSAKFSNPSTENKYPVSPIEREDQLGFYNNNSWVVKNLIVPGTSYHLIPASGLGGYMNTDSILIPGAGQIINDVNLFVALNHGSSTELQITLISPQGDSARVFSNESPRGMDNNVITIFDDQADSSLAFNRYTEFGPVIKGDVSLNSKFQGLNSAGYWKLSIYDNGYAANTGQLYTWGIQINNGGANGINSNNQIPEKYSLSQNYPNPFNPGTKITYSIPNPGMVELKIYDILGREVISPVNEFKNAGVYTLSFDGSNLASGVYFYRLKAGDFTETKKMMLIK